MTARSRQPGTALPLSEVLKVLEKVAVYPSFRFMHDDLQAMLMSVRNALAQPDGPQEIDVSQLRRFGMEGEYVLYEDVKAIYRAQQPEGE